MNVAINARATRRAMIGGVERYARELTDGLVGLRADRYRVFAPPAELAHKTGHVWEQAILPCRARRSALIYSPANLAPLASTRNVVVVHDAAPLRMPSSYSRSYASYHRLMLAALARRARLIITVSEFSRSELIDVLGIEAPRVAVVPGGVSTCFRPGVTSAGLRRYGLDRPYALVVATPSPRKNLEVLTAAARALAERGAELVLAGEGRGYLPGRAPGSGPRRLGYVPDSELPALYAGALALLQPSRYEGFGLTCLEAMGSGTPVVAARAGALPEVAGPAAILVDPEDPDEFADAALGACFDEDVRAALIAAGLERAAAFSWARSAELTDALIDGLLADGGPL